MSRDQIKSKVRENAIAWAVIAILSSGGGSAITSLRGPSSDEIEAISKDVQAIKLDVARIGQRLEDFVEHSRDKRTAAK